GPDDHLGRARDGRCRPPRVRGLGRGCGDDRPRLPRQSLDLRAADRLARLGSGTRRGRRGAALGHGPRRGAPRRRAGGALPAQVLSLVSRAPRGRRCDGRSASAVRRPWRGARVRDRTVVGFLPRARADRIGSVLLGRSADAGPEPRPTGEGMIKKRSARTTLLACMGIASLALLAGASPAAAKTKTKTFNQCVSTSQVVREGQTGVPASTANVVFPIGVPKFNGKPQNGTVVSVNSVGLRITHTFAGDIGANLVTPGGKV